MKKKLSISILLFLLVLPSISIYKINRTIPSAISLAQNKELKINLGSFVSAADSENGDLILKCPTDGSYDVDLNLLGLIRLKTVTVSASESKVLYPSGEAIGIKIYTDGVAVTAVSQNSPADKAGIECADVITHLNDVKILNAAHFSSVVNENGSNEMKITLNRNEITKDIFLTPMYQNGEYLIGAWVRDSSAGIGTMTYIDSENQSFAALGHGICDVDTQALLTLMQGNITNCNIVDCVKGEKGTPGRLCAALQNNNIGTIEKNSSLGIYGKVDTNLISKKSPIPIASRFEVCEGNATIITSIDDREPQEYSAVIEKVNTADESGLSLVLRITDQRLLEKTGGIVQGMSGSPIIQNGKFAGAVTHVFVNDPTRGYGIFIENMLAEAEKN